MKTCNDAKGFLGWLLAGMGLGITANTVIDLSDAPGGDLSLDDIFGTDPAPSTTVESSKPNDPQPPVVATTTPTEPTDFLKAKSGTVYKTREDAVEGIEHKDALIAQLRDQVSRNTGIDPITNRPVQPQQPSAPASYLDDQEKYFEDIAHAVERKDTKAYLAAQQKLIWDSLGPLAPTITSLSKANAERIVSSELPDFKGFLGSEQYEGITRDMPLLADAIRSAEQNPAAAAQLPELYKVAYLTAQGRRVPELIQSVRVETSPVQPRPTVHSAPVPPPATTGVPSAQPSLDTKDGRKELIKQMEDKGVMNLRW